AVHGFRFPRLVHSLRLRRRGRRVQHSRLDLHTNPINHPMVWTFVRTWVWGQLRLQCRNLLFKNRVIREDRLQFLKELDHVFAAIDARSDLSDFSNLARFGLGWPGLRMALEIFGVHALSIRVSPRCFDPFGVELWLGLALESKR